MLTKKSYQGLEIWNQHKATIRTNNPTEMYHSTMPSNIPRHHPLVSQINKFFKDQNAIASDKFLKLNNFLTKSQTTSSKKKIEFKYFLELTHVEYFQADAEADLNVKLLKFETYFIKIVNQIVGRFQNYPEIEPETYSESE